MIQSSPTTIYLLFAAILLFACSRTKDSTTTNSSHPTSEYYTADDFLHMQKFDSHIHLNTEQTYFIDQAANDNLRFLVIVDDRPFGITMEDQQKIARKQLKAFPDRIAYATTFSVDNFDNAAWQEETLSYLKDSFSKGAIAVKVWKNIGMDLRDKTGKFVMIDDPRLDPILSYLASNNVPLIGHLGEPRECWLPLDQMVLHKGYYSSHPEYHMYLHPEFPSYEDQINARDHMLEKHPDLKFIGAHLGSLEWSLEELAKRLDKYPNMAVDLARMSDLNLHAMNNREATRNFFIQYQDRLLYATDVQVRETDNPEAMNESMHEARMRFWKFYTTDEEFTFQPTGGTYRGLKLPREVVDKIYRKNAETWLGVR
ncbi:MAG: amidohydrolase [Bacteroidota bacterium]|nr:amidohydrolase [Bacteroidota bacterium]